MKDFLDYLLGKGVKNDFVRRINEEVNKARAHEEWRMEAGVYVIIFKRFGYA